jgi:DNA-binding MarR family transcriptional regulator
MSSDPAELQLALGVEMARHGKLLHLLRARVAGTVPQGLDAAALAVLITLVRCGPRRQGELADAAILDPSTASRYVTQLERLGLVERRRDPDDGRAVQLVATEAGQRLGDELAARRQEVLRTVVDGWSDDDLTTLVTLIRRLNDSLDTLRHNPSIEQEH